MYSAHEQYIFMTKTINVNKYKQTNMCTIKFISISISNFDITLEMNHLDMLTKYFLKRNVDLIHGNIA
jgi:hypothetical protein